ncbi:MAG: DUF4097 family beta strand repeat-containing protein [Acidimicrobiia bacterium]
MSDLREVFDVGGEVRLEVQLRSADVRIKKGESGKVAVRVSGPEDSVGRVDIDASTTGVAIREHPGGRRWSEGTIDVTVNLPHGSDVSIRVGGGDIRVGTSVNDLDINVGSGDVRVGDADGVVHVNVASGDVNAGELGGEAEVNSASGDVRIASARNLKVGSASGDLLLGELTGSGRITSASGDVRISSFSGSDLSISSMSGDALIGLISGMRVDADIKTLSGSLINQITPSDTEARGAMRLAIKSLSGDVILTSAK